MKTDTKVLPVSVRSITLGALTIALIVVFFTFFKGVTNILNAFFVPMILFSFSINRKAIELLAVFTASIAMCALFFNLQLIFIVFYCIIAVILSTLNRKNIGVALSAIVLSMTITFFFWSAIILTDMIFKTRMNEIMLKILNGNRLVYLLILAFEGTAVGISQLFASRFVLKKLRAFEQN
jgi:hypothetical protein